MFLPTRADGKPVGETLKVASEKKAYALTDRATYLAMKSALELAILFEKDEGLKNQYGVIAVAGARHEVGGQATFARLLVLRPHVPTRLGKGRDGGVQVDAVP